jgi:hypothetical protein
MDLLAQPTLRTNAEAVADDEHPDHQLWINRGPPHLAIVGSQMRPNLGQVDEPVDLSQQMIIGNAPLQTEAVKQRLPLTRRSPIIDRISRTQQKRISARASIKRSFSTQFAHSGHCEPPRTGTTSRKYFCPCTAPHKRCNLPRFFEV